MKFPQVVALVCCLILVDSSAVTESSKQDLKTRASAQLERLAPYRRSSPDQGTPIDQSQSLETSSNDPVSTNLDERQMALEIYQILPEDLQEDIVRRGSIAVLELLENPKYMALMQERIKRSGERNTGYETKRDEYSYSEYDRPPEGHPPEGHPPEGYGEYPPEPYGGGGDTYGQPANSGSDSGGIIQGSSSLIGGIAKGIIGGLVSASGSASTGSSSVSASSSAQTSSSSAASSAPQRKPEYQPYGQYGYYGHPAHPYIKKEFSVWDFKKAIISTLMQAVKAISGGVIALKGQLIKGGGYLVSSKGKMIAKAGDVITSLGTNIAKNAANPPAPAHPEYYEHHPEGGHEESYDGPPPGIEEYSDPNDGYHANLNYDSPSNVDDHAGLLIAKPSHSEDHDDHTTDVDPRKPSLTHPNDNYHGPPPELDEKDVENTVSGHGDHKPSSIHPEEPPHHPEHPPSSYEVPSHQYLFDDSKKGIPQEYPLYPPLIGGPPAGVHNTLSIQQSVEYPPVHIRYTVPIKGNLKVPLEDTSSNDLSVYGSLSIDSEPEIESTKVHAANQVGGFELPKLQPHDNFHNLPGFPSTYHGGALQAPLKAPLLNPYMTPYWQNQGLLQPFAGFDMYSLYRRRNALHRRRSVNDVLRQMRLSRA